MKIKYSLILALVLIIFTSCREDEIKLYNSKPALGVRILNADKTTSTEYSVPFGFVLDNEYIVSVKFQLTGEAVNYDRLFKLSFGGNAIPKVDYEMNETQTLPAGEIDILIDCKIIRSANLANEGDKELIINITESDALTSSVYNKVTIKFSSDIPTKWMSNSWAADYIMGDCTKEKYKFLYDMMGFFDLGTKDYGDFTVITVYLNGKIKEYNDDPSVFENKYGPTPMTDANGDLVMFGD